jgi:cryptochrome
MAAAVARIERSVASSTAARAGGLVAVHWFRKGLRLHDNPALLRAMQAADVVYPVFVIDPWFVSPERVGAVRMRFLLESLHVRHMADHARFLAPSPDLQDLNRSLEAMKSRLLVLRGKPTEVLPAVLKHWGATTLTFEADFEPYALDRDDQVTKAAQSLGVSVESFCSHTLYDPRGLHGACKGRPPQTFNAFQSLLAKIGPPPAPVPQEALLPQYTDGWIDPPAEFVFGDAGRAIPTLPDLGYDDRPTTLDPPLFPGGETEGMARLRRSLAREEWVRSFQKPDTSPTAVGEPDTTGLSPYLKFGCVSSRCVEVCQRSDGCLPHSLKRRLVWKELHEVYARGRHTAPPVSLAGQLLWREFYVSQGFSVPNYDKMVGNPVCRQIAWRVDPEGLRRWEEGATGYPFIDACMRQLRSQGWLHHLGRHAVACFLTRGDLYVSWEHGARVFDRLLVDADWALNCGNWLWLSASSYFYQFFRVYSPVAFPKKTDPEGHYVRRWCPELAKYPKQFIYEPWKAPLERQRAWGCVVGRDYPERVVVHEEVSRENIARHKLAYDAHAGRAEPLRVEDIGVGNAQVGSRAKREREGLFVTEPPAKRG